MHEHHVTSRQMRYMIKVLFGLALLALELLIALGLPYAAMGATTRQVAIVTLALIMLMQVQLVHWLYGRADELRQLIHRQACTRSLPWLAVGCGVAGLLQANGVIPIFNQFWTLGVLVALWGLQLMLADRPHH